MASTTTIFTSLLEAQRAIQNIKPNAKNEYHNFTYVSSDEMILEARTALHGAGLTLTRDSYTLDFSAGEFGILSSVFALTHPASATTQRSETRWIFQAEKDRPIDKALASALTSSLGYFLRDLLLVPRQEEDINSRDDTKFEPKPKIGSIPAPSRAVAPSPAPAPAPAKVISPSKAVQPSGNETRFFASRVPKDAVVMGKTSQVVRVGKPTVTRVGTNRYSAQFRDSGGREFWGSTFDDKVGGGLTLVKNNEWVEIVAQITDKGITIYGFTIINDDEPRDSINESGIDPKEADEIPF